MKKLIIFLIVFFQQFVCSQTINLNQDYIEDYLRYLNVTGKLKTDSSFTLRPLNTFLLDNSLEVFNNYSKDITKSNKLNFKILPVDIILDYNSKLPYNRNNGSMIPNRGYQNLLSLGFYFSSGPIEIQIKPEYHYAENKYFQGFWEGHDDVIWRERYRLWNHIDIPERFGNNKHSRFLIGQSFFKINFLGHSIGISNENLWWGPSFRNSIMLSNHAEGFKHIKVGTRKPLNSQIGTFEWELVSGRLEPSGYKPPNIDYEYAGTKLYIPKINQNGHQGDWRYFQGLIFSFSPKFIDGFTLGFIRWVQMYSALVEGKYTWMKGTPSYFPIFNNLFRKNDEFVDYEGQTDQAAGLFFRWLWKDSKAEIYGEFHHNDAKYNLRDLMLDSDHSRALTLGLKKEFLINNNSFLLSWEWTQMEQTAGRLIRNAGSWYEHSSVYDGYTNKGEVLGSSIGPGSNSQFFSISNYIKNQKIGLAFEIVEHDNDFYFEAFESAKDFRRFWKDFNIHLNYTRFLKNIYFSGNVVFSKNLNYQWGLDDSAVEPYYRPGIDVNNFHTNLKISYLIK